MGLVTSKETAAPGIHGLGCATVGDFQYAVGGALAAGESNYNYNMYKLDLRKLNEPNWELMNVKTNFRSLYPHIIQPTGTTTFTLLGGKKVYADTNFQSFDTLTLKWKKIAASKVYRNDDIAYLSYPYAGGFVQSDINKDEYFLWGGFDFTNDFSGLNFIKMVWIFNTKSGNWTKLNVDNGPEQYFGTTNVYNGGFYVIGGMSAKDDKVVSLETIYRFDFKSRTWNKLTCTGEDISSRSHHSAVVKDNLLYLVGGLDIDAISDRVDILNLDTLIWTKKSLPGLQGKNQGCVTYYKNNLIYSFGFSEPFDSKVQAIDTNSWSITSKSLDSQNPNSNNISPPVEVNQNSNNLGLIVGASIGSVFGLLLLIILGIYLFRRQQHIKQANKLYQEQIRAINQLHGPQDLNLPRDILDSPPELDLSFNSTDPGIVISSGDSDVATLRYNVEIPKEWNHFDLI